MKVIDHFLPPSELWRQTNGWWVYSWLSHSFWARDVGSSHLKFLTCSPILHEQSSFGMSKFDWAPLLLIGQKLRLPIIKSPPPFKRIFQTNILDFNYQNFLKNIFKSIFWQSMTNFALNKIVPYRQQSLENAPFPILKSLNKMIQ